MHPYVKILFLRRTKPSALLEQSLHRPERLLPEPLVSDLPHWLTWNTQFLRDTGAEIADLEGSPSTKTLMRGWDWALDRFPKTHDQLEPWRRADKPLFNYRPPRREAEPHSVIQHCVAPTGKHDGTLVRLP
ncbi:hypothetical protein GCM10007426_32060 [Alloalcanivorax dieselolei]|nr:hypothetical protein GCM10007426_32060 [Alloalcanivorax dieselolei]